MEVNKLFDLLGPQLELLKKDGGITFSGGEPLLQSEALTQLAKLCKEAGYHTALETSGIVPLAAIERIHPFIDTWLLGMRLVTSDDPAERNHLEKYTRQTMNYLKHSDVLVRIPVIPGFTTTEYYLTLTRQILENYRQAHIEILPMNPETAHYYQAIGQTSEITYDESQAARLYEYVCEFLNIKTLNKQV
jgi:Pyruvate-formate lyase-activating enzyme